MRDEYPRAVRLLKFFFLFPYIVQQCLIHAATVFLPDFHPAIDYIDARMQFQRICQQSRCAGASSASGEVGQRIHHETGLHFGARRLNLSHDILRSLSLPCHLGGPQYLQPDSGGQALGIYHEHPSLIIFFRRETHNIAGCTHFFRNAKKDDILIRFHARSKHLLCVFKGDSRRLWRPFICLCPGKYLIRRNLGPVIITFIIQYDAEGQYGDLIKEAGAEVEVIFANQPQEILKHAKNVLTCDIHTRARTKRILEKNGAKVVLGLDNILTCPVDGSGCNERFGLLGSNKSTEESVKLFPRDCTDLVLEVQGKILEKTGKHVEVMVYGDGAFKDPVGKIWELADPCVSVAHTEGLNGTPNEVKLKYLADNDFKDLKGEELKDAISKRIQEKEDDLVGDMSSQGTTPRRLTDLIGSLCDLTSGSGDKGTPVILVQGYFDNFTTDK